MSFLHDIYSEIESEFIDGQEQISHMSAFYTLINYLELIDNGNGLSEKDLKNRFYQRSEYKTIIQKFITHNVLIQSNEGNFTLNKQAKQLISPIFDNLMALPTKKLTDVPKNDPGLNLLYNYRSKLFFSE